MAETWNHNYLFLVNPSVQLTVMGHNAFSVTDICMEQPTIDEFVHYVMDVDVSLNPVNTFTQYNWPS